MLNSYILIERKKLLLFIIPFFILSCATKEKAVQVNSGKSPYSIIIDAGSTGSRLYVYKIEHDKNTDVPNIILVNQNDKNGKVEPGISEFENNTIKGASNITTLVDRAKQIIEPKFQRQTPVYILATAGMRLIDKVKRERILEKVADVVEKDKVFKVKSATTISGRYEGLYGWLAINYLDDKFDLTKEREGLLEMGGSSTQISFVPNADFVDHKLQRKIKGKVYDIYSRSFLRLGTNQVKDLVFSTDCYLENSLENGKKGTGNGGKCISQITDKFKEACDKQNQNSRKCNLPHCVLESANIPSSNDSFIAVSGFYYSLKFLGLEKDISLDALYSKVVELCASDYNELEKNYGEKPNKYNKDYCLLSSYYWLLLKKGYQMPTSSKISISKNDISWTLGAALDIELGFSPELYIDN